MAERQRRAANEQPAAHHRPPPATRQASARRPAPPAPPTAATAATLLRAARQGGRGNGPADQAAVQRLQQTLGNRAARRFVQRYASGPEPVHGRGARAAPLIGLTQAAWVRQSTLAPAGAPHCGGPAVQRVSDLKDLTRAGWVSQ